MSSLLMKSDANEVGQGPANIMYDYGYGHEPGRRGSREGQLIQDLNMFGEIPSNLASNFQSTSNLSSSPPCSQFRDPRSEEGQYLTKMGAPYEQSYDFENAHFDETFRKFNRMTEEKPDRTSSQRRNSDSSFSGIDLEDLMQFTRNTEGNVSGSGSGSSDEYYDVAARRVQSMPYPSAVDRFANGLHTRSLDAISRDQQQMVRQSQQVQSAPIQFPSHFQQQPQQQQYYNTSAAVPVPNKSVIDPRQYLSDTFHGYESPFTKRFGSTPPLGNSTVGNMYDPSSAYSNSTVRPQGIASQGGAQYSNFLQKLPSAGGRPQPPIRTSLYSNANTNAEYDTYGAFQGNHQLMQQSRGGITTANGGLLNLSASRGQLLIGSNQGRGVYSEKSSNNLIGAGLYDGTGTVYVVQLKCQYRHYVLDTHAPQHLKTGDFVIVDADRGEDLGIIIELLPMMAFVERQRSMHISLEDEQNEVGRILREASMYEREQLPNKYQDELMVIELCKNLSVNTYQMQMIVVDAEYQFDRHKLTVYYDSAIRIDFRELVRDLFAAFKTRIWFKKANNRYFKAKQYALMALATGDAGMEDWQQQQQQQQVQLR